MTKQARLDKAQQIKSTHFQLGYGAHSKTMDAVGSTDQEALRQKWNPQNVISKGNMAKSNWQLGNNSNFEALSQNRSDF